MSKKQTSNSSETNRFAQRLNEALDIVQFPKLGGGRQSRLSELLDVPSVEVGHWLKGESFPRTSALVKLSDITKTRSNWLLSGQGEPQQKADNPHSTGKPSQGSDTEKLSKEAFELGKQWTKLPKQQREAIARVITELLNTQ